MDSALVSWGCPIKLPQTWWLKTTETYSPTVLENRSLKSKCLWDTILWKEESFLPFSSFWCFPVFLGFSDCMTLGSQGLLLSQCLCLLLLSLVGTPAIVVRAHPGNPGSSHLKILNSVTLQRPSVQIRPNSQVAGVRMWTCFFMAHHLTHYRHQGTMTCSKKIWILIWVSKSNILSTA